MKFNSLTNWHGMIYFSQTSKEFQFFAGCYHGACIHFFAPKAACTSGGGPFPVRNAMEGPPYLPRMVALGGELKTLQLAALGEIKKRQKSAGRGGPGTREKEKLRQRRSFPWCNQAPLGLAIVQAAALVHRQSSAQGLGDGTGWEGSPAPPGKLRARPAGTAAACTVGALSRPSSAELSGHALLSGAR